MKCKLSILSSTAKAKIIFGLAATSIFSSSLISSPVLAESQFSEKAIAVIQSCDTTSPISGFATLKERASTEGVKEIDVYMQVDGLTFGKHAVHIHETASCLPCGSAAGHFDPGNFGMTNPDANHPFHSGDLINIESDGTSGLMTTQTSRVTLSDGPLSLFDADGSSFIVHVLEDSYCPGGEVAGCAGGARAACGIISKVNLLDDFELMVSRSSSRSNAVELSDAELYDNAYIFLSPVFPSTSVQTVTYYLNGDEFHTEFYVPYDFTGTYSNGDSGVYNTNNLPDGTHTIAAEIRLNSGGSTFVSAQFRVANNFSQFGSDGDDDD